MITRNHFSLAMLLVPVKT